MTNSKLKKKKKAGLLRGWHKWIGFAASFFIILFSISGIFLNHRQGVSSFGISRSLLPEDYRYENWNNGAVRGTYKLSPDSIIVYGGSGVWLSDSTRTRFQPYGDGMKSGIDNQNISHIVQTSRGELFAVTTFDLYQLSTQQNKWTNLTSVLGTNERLADITTQGDSLIVTSRSHAYISIFPYTSFRQIELLEPDAYKKEISLFRSFWTIHSGEMFGYAGRLFVDFIAVVFIVLCLSGIIILFFPGIVKRTKKYSNKLTLTRFRKGNLLWHNRLGAWLLLFSIIIIVTGVFLRPPLLMHVVRDKTAPIPFSAMDSDNPWFEKIRNLRYDAFANDWVLYTSDGFYILDRLDAVPQRLIKAPRTSVMGINVLEQIHPGLWVVGSFSGLYYWDKAGGNSIDVTQVRPAFMDGQRVMGNMDASGYSNDFGSKEFVFSYSSGAIGIGSQEAFAAMPAEVKESDMSLWHVSLEVHVCRIYYKWIGNNADSFVLLSGIVMVFIFLSGYIVYWRIYRKRKKTNVIELTL